MAATKIFVSLVCLQVLLVSSNSLYDLFRSPSSFFKIRNRRNNNNPQQFRTRRTEARILNKDIFPPPGGPRDPSLLRKKSARRSDEYLEEPSSFFPSKPIHFDPNFKQMTDNHSEETEFSLTHKLSNPLQFKSRKDSDLTTSSPQASANAWNSLEIVESLPERYTFWPHNNINFGQLEKNRKVYAEERISVDEDNEGEEKDLQEIPTFSSLLVTNQSSLTDVAAIKREPIQLTPSLSFGVAGQTNENPIELTEVKEEETSIDNIEHFFGQLAKKEIAIVASDVSTSTISTTTEETVSQNINEEEDPMKIENFFGQLADASNFSLLQNTEITTGGNSSSNNVIPENLTSNTKIINNDKETYPENPIIIDIKNNNDDDPILDDKSEIYLGVTGHNTSTAGSDIEIIVDTNDELTEEYEITANKSSQHQSLDVIDATSLNLTDHNQSGSESEISVRTLEKPREKNDLDEKEEIISTIQELTEETTTFTIADDLQETDTDNDNMEFNQDTEGNNGVDNSDQETDDENEMDNNDQDSNETDSDDKQTTGPPEEVSTRRLPARYVSSKTRSGAKVTTKPTPKVINHNMNLQTALIINTLSKVLPNVPQSRLKNQPRLETVGLGVTFHQEELFIFHSTLTELHAILDKSLKRGGLPSDLMVSIFAAKEHTITLVHLFYKLLLEAEASPDKTLTISKEDSRIFAKHFHFLRAIFPFL